MTLAADLRPILSIDTALGDLGLCLFLPDAAQCGHGQVIGVVHQEACRNPAEVLAPAVEALLRDTGVKPADIAAVGATIGPGGFTGLRAGLAFARGWGLALGVPVVGIGTLDALAMGVDDPALPRASLIHAGGGWFAALFAGSPLTSPPTLAASAFATEAEAIAALTDAGLAADAPLIGHGAEPRTASLSRVSRRSADPVDIARLAAARDPAQHPPRALYLRAPYAS
jgi:tRNA threonylcarbamoyladenosine biosynthesis protein TsaB